MLCCMCLYLHWHERASGATGSAFVDDERMTRRDDDTRCTRGGS